MGNKSKGQQKRIIKSKQVKAEKVTKSIIFETLEIIKKTYNTNNITKADKETLLNINKVLELILDSLLLESETIYQKTDFGISLTKENIISLFEDLNIVTQNYLIKDKSKVKANNLEIALLRILYVPIKIVIYGDSKKELLQHYLNKTNRYYAFEGNNKFIFDKLISII